MSKLTGLIEAIVFTYGDALPKKELLEKIPELSSMAELNKCLKEIEKKYSYDSGVLFINMEGKVQFSSNPLYGEQVAEALKKVKEKQLTEKVMDVLGIIAYKQPITRSEIEDFRSTSAEYALSVLLQAGLITVTGRRQVVGLPLEYGTTDEFLKKFEIASLDELPDAEYITQKVQELNRYNPDSEELFSDRSIDMDTEEQKEAAADAEPKEKKKDEQDEPLEIPDFLKDEQDVLFIDSDELDDEDEAAAEEAALSAPDDNLFGKNDLTESGGASSTSDPDEEEYDDEDNDEDVEENSEDDDGNN